jgi:c-di-GMP-binding flagellar brake protein YcgR
VSAEFDLAEAYEGGKVVDIKSRTSQTALFKNFLKLVEMHEDEKKNQNIKYRIQDLSVTGMSLQIGELESQFFKKDFIFKDVQLHFPDELIMIPQVKVVYIVDYISRDKKIKTYKVGLHFLNLTTTVDEMLGRKINELLRQIDFNKDFENFTK